MTQLRLNIKPEGRSVITYETSSIEIFMNPEDRSGRLSELYSVNRGQGYATGLMGMICEWADKNDVYLWLVARPYGNPRGGLDQRDLVSFYERFGFHATPETKKDRYVMGRFPGEMA